MNNFNAAMSALGQRFVARCREDLPKLQSRIADLPEGHGTIQHIAHRMAGSAGLFGYETIGALASQVDDQLYADPAAEPAALPALIDALEDLLRAS